MIVFYPAIDLSNGHKWLLISHFYFSLVNPPFIDNLDVASSICATVNPTWFFFFLSINIEVLIVE